MIKGRIRFYSNYKFALSFSGSLHVEAGKYWMH